MHMARSSHSCKVLATATSPALSEASVSSHGLNSKVPETNLTTLVKVMHKFVDDSPDDGRTFDFDEYNTVKRSWAIRGKALAANKDIMLVLKTTCDVYRFKASDLKKVLQRVFLDRCHRKLNPTTRLNEDFMRATVTSLLVMCAHCRRLNSKKLFKQAASKCSKEEIETLKLLRPNRSEDCESSEDGESSACAVDKFSNCDVQDQPEDQCSGLDCAFHENSVLLCRGYGFYQPYVFTKF